MTHRRGNAPQRYEMVVTGQIDASQAESQILHPSSRALFRFWETMRAERAAPHRAQLDLKQLSELLPDLFILERDRPRHSYRWRLAGTRICELYRRELTGSDIFAGWDSFERETIRRLLDGVAGRLQPAVMRIRLYTSLGQTIGAEVIALPLRPRSGAGIQVFGGLFPFRNISGLGYDAITVQEMASARVIWTEPLPGDSLISGTASFRPFQVITGKPN
jgi:hypothetical protein